MRKIALMALLAGFVATSCTESKKGKEPTHTGTEGPEADPHAAHAHQGDSGDTNTSVLSSKPNPPHGEPGHRCDIPVGAPLDSKPGQQNNVEAALKKQAASVPQPNSNNGQGFLKSGNNNNTRQGQSNLNAQQIRQQTQQQIAQNNVTAPGMQGKPNPAHGQPGHRCDIQVGQPLP